MNYEIVELKEKKIVGLCKRVNQNDPKLMKKIGMQWQKFIGEGVWKSIKNTVNEHNICTYSNYSETEYDINIGAEISSNDNEELVEKIIPAGKYAKFTIKGDVTLDVANVWSEIWCMKLDRSFVCDFEEYLSNDNGVADIEIYVSLK